MTRTIAPPMCPDESHGHCIRCGSCIDPRLSHCYNCATRQSDEDLSEVNDRGWNDFSGEEPL